MVELLAARCILKRRLRGPGSGKAPGRRRVRLRPRTTLFTEGGVEFSVDIFRPLCLESIVVFRVGCKVAGLLPIATVAANRFYCKTCDSAFGNTYLLRMHLQSKLRLCTSATVAFSGVIGFLTWCAMPPMSYVGHTASCAHLGTNCLPRTQLDPLFFSLLSNSFSSPFSAIPRTTFFFPAPHPTLYSVTVFGDTTATMESAVDEPTASDDAPKVPVLKSWMRHGALVLDEGSKTLLGGKALGFDTDIELMLYVSLAPYVNPCFG